MNIGHGSAGRDNIARPRRAGWVDDPACAVTLADNVIPQRPCRELWKKALRGFQGSPARLADKRAPEPPSCQSPLPEARFLASGLHPSNVRTSESLAALLNGILPVLFCDKRVYRKTARRINRAFTMLSGSVSFEARSTPKMRVASSDFHQQRCSGKVFGPVQF